MKKRGFTAIESSISLALFLAILLAAFEFFGLARSFFFKLKNAQEGNQAAIAALDKMKVDLLRAGSGLLRPAQQGAVESIAIIQNALIISICEKAYSLLEDLSAGENRIVLPTITGLSPGREVCIYDEEKAEVKTISSIEGKAIILTAPLEASYSTSETEFILLEKISLFFDEKTGCIRRKVNSSPPQPVLDDVLYFEFAYEKEANLATFSFAPKNNEEKKYELWVYPKNIALAFKNS